MKRRWPVALAIVLAAGFAYGALRLFGIQFAVGDVYPEYSSLRSDPMGTKLLFDSLGGLENVRADRNYLPLEYLPDHGASILFLGTPPSIGADKIKPLEAAARRGNRVVIALRLPPSQKRPEATPMETAWRITLSVDDRKGSTHRLSFAETGDWKVMDRIGQKTLAIQKDFGKGTVALLAESDDFTNESTIAMDRLRQVTEAIGPYNNVVFDEQHLGIAEAGSVAGLARRFRLTGLVLGLGLVAALFLWRNASGFPPAAETESGERLSGRTSQAGLVTLLRKHIPPRELAAVCWQEWRRGSGGQISATKLERAEAIARAGAGRPLEAIREIGGVLHAKGEL